MNLFPEKPQPFQIRPLEVTGNIEDAASPALIRQTWRVVIMAIIPLIVWAALAPIQEVAHVPGQVVPSGSVQVIQHLDGGVIRDILVQDNMLVEKDQVLFLFDGQQALSELNQVESRLAALQARAIRAEALANNLKPDFSSLSDRYANLVAAQQRLYEDQLQSRESNKGAISTQIARRLSELRELKDAKKNAIQQVALTKDMLEIRRPLLKEKAISRVVFLETVRANITAMGEVKRFQKEMENMQNAIQELKSRQKELITDSRREAIDELASVTNEIAQVREKHVGLKARVSRLEVRSPVRGIVQELNIVSKVVPPAEVLAKIVPLDGPLEVEVRFKPENIGRITVGSPVVIKLSSYSFVHFGQVKGTLLEISPSTLLDERNQLYYRGIVHMEKNYLGDTPGLYPILPGMMAQVDVALDKRKMLEIMLRPLTGTLNNAFKEH
ncbi:MAG: HlyD family type I secretion periplasmic adaptor subunit [Magnetococcales bacterium]|nr:HlyD family type I secretion periplasmic adaptor subunit [Magnetococcales bacterium]